MAIPSAITGVLTALNVSLKSLNIIGVGASATLRGITYGMIAGNVAMRAFESSITSLIHTVNLFDPSAWKALELAVRDSKAVIGEIFRPIVVLMTSSIRRLGDTLATMKPALDPFIRSLEILINFGFKGAIHLLQQFTPLIHLLGLALEVTLTPLILVTELIGGLTTGLYLLGKAIEFTLAPLALIPGVGKYLPKSYEDLEKRYSTGKAVRHTERMSADELGNKFREGAYGGTNALSAQIENTKAINNLTDKLNQWLGLQSTEKNSGDTILGTISEDIERLLNVFTKGVGQSQPV